MLECSDSLNMCSFWKAKLQVFYMTLVMCFTSLLKGPLPRVMDEGGLHSQAHF